MCTNSVKFFLAPGFDDSLITNIIDKVKEMPRTVKVERGSIEQDGETWEYFNVVRTNHFSMSNGTAIRFELESGVSIEDIANNIVNYVDNIV